MSKHLTKPFNPIEWPGMPHDFSGEYNLGIRAIETTQRYVYGTRYTTWDGRVFKYCNAVAAVYSYHGCHVNEASVKSWTATPIGGAKGDRHAWYVGTGRSEDDLAGGFFMLNDNSGTDTTWFFGITGNEASGAANTKCYLDGGIPEILTTSDQTEVFENPYRELTEANSGVYAWIGVPAHTAGTGYKFWCQTWGPAYISGGTTLSEVSDTRKLVWGSNASLFNDSDKTGGQVAGYQFQGTGGTAGPTIYLMCST